MADTTAISWTDYTWSPWTGCARISPACEGCYAAQLMDTRMHRAEWGAPGSGEGTRSIMSEDYWKKPLAWNRKAAKAMVVLSGYASELYDDALSDWKRVTRTALADGARTRTEVLWVNPAGRDRLNAIQIPLSLEGAA